MQPTCMSVRNTCNRILCVRLTVISTSLAHSKKSIVWYVAIKLEGRLNGGKLDPSPRHAFRVTASSHVDVTTIVSDDQFETQFIVYIQRRYPIYNAHRRTNISYVKVRVHIREFLVKRNPLQFSLNLCPEPVMSPW